MKKLWVVFLACCLAGCKTASIGSGMTGSQARRAIRSHYMKKYPVYAEAVTQEVAWLNAMRREDGFDHAGAHRIQSLYARSPVVERPNSGPYGHGNWVFVEKTIFSETEIEITRIWLNDSPRASPGVVLKTEKRPRLDGEAASSKAPMTEGDLIKLLK